MAINEQKDPLNALTFIKSAKWRSAWFTTFTLNVAFFEAYVLPELHAAGCDDITVFVDEVFYLGCLNENPRHAGTAYRILPIAIDAGVFHAKLSYLAGREGPDLLMVGSGNLTWPGYGHHLECLEVLESSRDAIAFSDLAAILGALTRRPDVHAATAMPLLEAWRRRIEHISTEPSKSSEVRLVSSVSAAVSDQISSLLKHSAPFREMVVVSPFHSRDAAPLIRLASSLQVRQVSIVVDLELDHTPVRQGLKGIRFVRREDVDEKRSIHAKWYEFRGSDTWVMIGSVNATKTSLESSANFEVAVVRPINPRALPKWIAHEPEEYGVPPEPIPDKDADCLALTASLRGNRINGRFLRAGGTDGKWRANLRQDGIKTVLDQVDVSDGGFSIGIGKFDLQSEPCQLVLRHGGKTASAWLMFEAELGMTSSEREFARRVRRLNAGDAAPDDFLAVIGWLAERVGRLYPDEARPTSGHSGQEFQQEAPKGAFDFARWIYREPTGNHTVPLLGSCRVAFTALARFTEQSRHGRHIQTSHGSDFGTDDENFQDGEAESHTEQVAAQSLAALERALQRSLNESIHPPDVAEFLLEAHLWALMLCDREGRTVALDCVPFVQWTALGNKYLSRYPTDRPLAVLSAAVCACGFSLLSEKDPRKERFAVLAKRAANALKSSDVTELVRQAIDERPCFSVLSPEAAKSAAHTVVPMLAYEGFSQKLAAYLLEWESGAGTSFPPADLVEQTGGLVQLLKNIPPRSGGIKHWTGELPDRCTDRCYHKFDASDLSVLRNRRAIKCIHCGTLHFWTGVAA